MVRYGVNVQSALLSCYVGRLSLTLILSHWALSDNHKLENGQLTVGYYTKSSVTENEKNQTPNYFPCSAIPSQQLLHNQTAHNHSACNST